jgi:hypothetical protein
MPTKAAVPSARLLVGAAVVCTRFVGNIAAKENIVTVSVRVSCESRT